MSFSVGLSGLNNLSKALDVVGNNISNANTIGFKTSQAHFADVYAAAVGGTPQGAGLGTIAPTVIQSFAQGGVRTSDNPLDVAINGQGFFRLDDAGTVSYTRNGEFQLVGQAAAAGAAAPAAAPAAPAGAAAAPQQSLLVNAEGLHVTGYLADFSVDRNGLIEATGDPADILVDQTMPGAETTSVSTRFNLDDAALRKLDNLGNPLPFVPNDVATYNYSFTVRTYDTLGDGHDLSMYFAKEAAPRTWSVHTTRDGGKAVGGVDLETTPTYPLAVTAGTNDRFGIQVDGGALALVTLRPSAAGYSSAAALVAGIQTAVNEALGTGKATVSLDSANHLVVRSATPGVGSSVTLSEGNGALAAYFGAVQSVGGEQTVPVSISFDTSGKILPASQILSLDYSNGTAPVTVNMGGSTQFAGAFGVSEMTQDGYARGEITGISVGDDGVIHAGYSNGLTRNAAQIALASFANPGGLINIGNNQWVESLASGKATVDAPTKSGLGAVQGSAVEEANVDLSVELVALIVQQRNYQANAQAIKAQDQLLQTLSGIR